MKKLPPLRVASLADIDLRRKYKAIDSVATGRIPSLFCETAKLRVLRILLLGLGQHQTGHIYQRLTS